jgi:plastocyanin
MRRGAASSRRIRAGVLAALLGGLLALGAPSAVALTATTQVRSHATRSTAHRSKCARHARRRHARRARRCRAKRHEKTSAPVAPVAPVAAPVTPTAPAAPAVAAAAPSHTAAPAPIIISSPPETKEAAPEEGEAEPPSISHVQVNAVEYSFSLSRTSVPAGKVVLEFVNDGQDEHNLHLESGEGPLSESIGDTPSKGVSDLHLEMQPGSYTLFCSLPTHESRGMKATLTVE